MSTLGGSVQGYDNTGWQLATTIGINFGLNNINALCDTTKDIPKNTFESFAVIVCDTY